MTDKIDISIKLKRIIFVVAAFATLISTSCSGKKPKEDNTTPQTIIFYFTGTQLSYYFYRNISAAKDAVRTDIKGRSRVVCFFQSNDKSKADIIELVYNNGLCEEKVLASYTMPAVMDEENLGYYFNEIIRLAPAQRYGLIMAGHALAWLPIGSTPDAELRQVVSSTDKLGIEDDYWRKAESNIETRFFGESYTVSASNHFDIETLSNALTSTGVKFEYILFDACFMANIESAYDLRTNSKYIIGAPCEILGDGFPYNDVLPNLLLKTGTSYDLDAVCKNFYDQYAAKYGYSGSISLIDCSQLDALASTVKRINNGAVKEYNADELQSYEGQARHIFYDLGDYIDNMCDDQELKAAFDKQMAKTIPHKYTLASFWSNYGAIAARYPITSFSGVSTSAPASIYRTAYAQTAWYKATH